MKYLIICLFTFLNFSLFSQLTPDPPTQVILNNGTTGLLYNGMYFIPTSDWINQQSNIGRSTFLFHNNNLYMQYYDLVDNSTEKTYLIGTLTNNAVTPPTNPSTPTSVDYTTLFTDMITLLTTIKNAIENMYNINLLDKALSEQINNTLNDAIIVTNIGNKTATINNRMQKIKTNLDKLNEINNNVNQYTRNNILALNNRLIFLNNAIVGTSRTLTIINTISKLGGNNSAQNVNKLLKDVENDLNKIITNLDEFDTMLFYLITNTFYKSPTQQIDSNRIKRLFQQQQNKY